MNWYKQSQGSEEFNRTQWSKNNPYGRNFMSPTDYDKEKPGYHIIADHPSIMYFYKIPGNTYEEAWGKWLDSKGNGSPRDSEYYDSEKDYASDHDYWGRIAFEEPDEDEDEDEDEDY
tara:strand:+ start:159 stop:509 length:351 start_codon:yes stop_codon:yes gene_type:complete